MNTEDHEIKHPQPPKFIQGFATVFLLVSAVAVLFCALFIPPQGEIHPSVLYALAMFLTFVGTMTGIDYKFKSNEYKLFNDFSKFVTSRKSQKSKNINP